MNHLREEQFEEIMQGEIQGKNFQLHLNECKHCRESLAEKRAVANRLREAFETVKPDESLKDAIRSRISERRRQSEVVVSGGRSWKTHISDKIWKPLAAAAVLTAVVFPLFFYLIVPSSAIAGQAELVRIHEHNLSPHTEFFSDADPEKLAAYFKDMLGFSPAVPALGEGMDIRGCCVSHFKDQIAGSYVVSTPRGIISVIMVPDTPKELALDRMPGKGTDKIFWKSSYADNNLAAVRLGDYTYSAVGDISNISHEYLKSLLAQLLSDSK